MRTSLRRLLLLLLLLVVLLQVLLVRLMMVLMFLHDFGAMRPVPRLGGRAGMTISRQQPRILVLPRFLRGGGCCCCCCCCCCCGCCGDGFLTHECDVVAAEGAAGRDGHAAVEIGGVVVMVVLLVLLELVVVREGGRREGGEGGFWLALLA